MNSETLIKNEIQTFQQQAHANARYAIQQEKMYKELIIKVNNKLKQHSMSGLPESLYLKNNIINERNSFREFCCKCSDNIQSRLAYLHDQLSELKSE